MVSSFCHFKRNEKVFTIDKINVLFWDCVDYKLNDQLFVHEENSKGLGLDIREHTKKQVKVEIRKGKRSEKLDVQQANNQKITKSKNETQIRNKKKKLSFITHNAFIL